MGSWINRQKNDKYYRKSKNEGHRARSYYKLEQIDRKYNLFHIYNKFPKRILDLGAAPGAWLELIKEKYLNLPKNNQCKNFKAIGIDTTTIRPFKQADFIETYRLNIFKPDCEEKIQNYLSFDVILSDLSPKTAGDFRDLAIQESMVKKVFYFADKYLTNHGNVVIKIFQSSETDIFVKKWKNRFRILKRMKPAASRKSSRELYLIGINFKKRKY